LRNCYNHRCRPRVPLEMMLRVVLSQYLYDLSDRQMEEELNFNMAIKYFASLASDKRGVDH